MRRLLWLGVAVTAVVALWGVGRVVVAQLHGDVGAPDWLSRTVYPLEHESVIRAAAKKHKLDPALVAAVIYVESGFDETARSPQGAVGLMQVLPETAAQIAKETGGSAFVTADLEDPKVNVRYGTYYLRRSLDQFDGDTFAAVAAYNAGGSAVRRWEAEAEAEGHELRVGDIPYAETRAYVDSVLRVRTLYRETYGDRLTLPE